MSDSLVEENKHEDDAKLLEDSNDNKENSSRKKTLGWIKWFFIFLFFIVVLALSGIAYYSVDYLNSQNSKIENLHQQINTYQQQINAIANENRAGLQSLNSRQSTFDERLASADALIVSQNKRLLSLSSTSREDWLLAEAEYLLKLANQRVLVEKSARSAEGLMVEADNILTGLEDPDLFAIRKAIAADLAALRLINTIDVEGIYLQLVAMAAQVENIPYRPTRQALRINNIAEESEPVSDNNSFMGNVKRFFSGLQHYIRIVEHDRPHPVLLPPDATQYLKQNLRLMLEKAQIALLREQQDIYIQSLMQADAWINEYFPPTDSSQSFRQQLVELSQREIEQALPDISNSLELLHGYIESLHNLKGN